MEIRMLVDDKGYKPIEMYLDTFWVNAPIGFYHLCNMHKICIGFSFYYWRERKTGGSGAFCLNCTPFVQNCDFV